MTTWKRKGPKGCYETMIEGRKTFLSRAGGPYGLILWSLHIPEPGGYYIHTLAARTKQDIFRLADRVIADVLAERKAAS
jgi:hypothetical protein